MSWFGAMDSKDVPQDSYAGIRTRSKRASLHLDTARLEPVDRSIVAIEEDAASGGQASPDSTMSSPSQVASADIRPRSATMTSGPPTASLSRPTSSSGVQRNRSATVSSPRPSTASTSGTQEKRKRSRVTPDQLVQLERLFAQDRSPTAAQRKAISERLGMHERQTQIWFQNRRAKAKLQDTKGKHAAGRNPSPTSGHGGESPPDTPPQLTAGFEADLHTLIHEADRESIAIIPCVDLAIGTWRRIATVTGKHDLVAYICEAKQCLTWFIHSAGYGFKMEIPFDTITTTDFTNAAPGQGLASFYLSQPPIFYMESISSPDSNGRSIKSWKKCTDWTEGMQATKVLRHDLVGSALQLAHALRSLPGGTNITSSDPTLLQSFSGVDSPSPTMQIPAPPPMGPPFTAGYPYTPQGGLSLSPRPRIAHGRKRSFSGPPALTAPAPSISNDLSDANFNASNTSFAHRPQAAGSSLVYSIPEFSQGTYPPYQPMPTPTSSHSTSSHHQHQHSLGEYTPVPISHAATGSAAGNRSFNSLYTSRPSFASDGVLPRPGSAHAETSIRRFSEAAAAPPMASLTPPLLTSPFTPGMPSGPQTAGPSNDTQHLMGVEVMRGLHMDAPLSGHSMVMPFGTGSEPVMRSPAEITSDPSSSLEGALGIAVDSSEHPHSRTRIHTPPTMK